jgi:hypothetical protein
MRPLQRLATRRLRRHPLPHRRPRRILLRAVRPRRRARARRRWQVGRGGDESQDAGDGTRAGTDQEGRGVAGAASQGLARARSCGGGRRRREGAGCSSRGTSASGYGVRKGAVARFFGGGGG